MLSPVEVYEDMLFGEWGDAELDFLAEARRFEFNEFRQSLIDRHLVDVTSDANGAKLSMHRVLKRHILQQIDDAGTERLNLIFVRAVAMVRRQFPKAHELQTPTSEASVECERCLPHILSLVAVYRDWASKIRPPFDLATLLANTATNYTWERGLTHVALPILEMGERVCNKLSHVEEISLVRANICAIAGCVFKDIGLSGRAIALEKCKKGLELRQGRVQALQSRGDPVDASTFLQLANALNDVGVAKLAYGCFEKALPYLLESQRLKEEQAGEEDIPWHYGELYKNLAFVKLHQGDALAAEDMARRSCDLCSLGRTETDASTQSVRSILGIVLMNIGKMDEALRLHKGVYRARKQFLGETHLHTKNSQYLVAELSRRKGKLSKAEFNFRAALSQCEFSWS
ncbi:hypothetical protein B0T25DRAFT_566139 [Lasiosphaeria hispida]|uniref:Uncharacterized protein n=1 Tax=Lasiosphaeria hispida TaxID=260671 RepID=A0AAJ0HL83_9PEZI|nr:hypothetical protein B0T25DRAFT_566139 [Lasiosphaeria hispida]